MTISYGDNLNNFYYYANFNLEDLNLGKQNIYVFAISYIDMTAYNLNYASYKYLDGPLVSEIVKQQNIVPTTATLFKLPDGSIWTGPIHEHEGSFMKGSFHLETQHEDLTSERVLAKTTDLMDDVLSETVGEEGLMGEHYYYLENENETNFLVIDLINVALSSFKTARQLYNTNKNEFLKLMKDFSVLHLEVRKSPLKKRIGFLDMGTKNWDLDDTKETILARTKMTDGMFEERYEMEYYSKKFNVDPNKLTAASNSVFDINTFESFEKSTKIGHIKPLPLNQQYLHNLLLIDEQYYRSTQDYKIKLILEVENNFKNYLESIKEEAASLILDLNLDYIELTTNSTNEKIINFFANNGIALDENLLFVRIQSEDLYSTSIFAKVKNVLSKILLVLLSDEEQIGSMIQKAVSSLYVNSRNPESFNDLQVFILNLLNKMIEKYSLTKTNNRPVINKSGLVRMEKVASNVIFVNNIVEGSFNYFNKDKEQITISVQDYKNRSSQEFNKFFTRDIQSGEILQASPDLGSAAASQMVDFEKTKHIFYTPVSYDVADQSHDLSKADISIFDEKVHDLISNYGFDINKQTKKQRRSGLNKKRNKLGIAPRGKKTKLLSTLSIKKPFKKSKAVGDSPEYENASEYLGNASLFLNTSLGTRRKELTIKDAPAVLLRKTFSQSKKIDNFKKISIDNEESDLLKLKNKIDFSLLPLQFRSLVLSNYGLSRFSFPLEEDQLIENARFSTILNNVYSRVKIARYLGNFDVNDNGLRTLSKPNYLPLTEEVLNSGVTLMIKMFDYKNTFLQMIEEDEIPSVNTICVIEGTNTPEEISAEQFSMPQPTDRILKEASTTNVIKQNENKKQITKFIKADSSPTKPPTPNPSATNSLRPTQSGRSENSTNRVSTSIPRNRGSY